MSDPYGRPVDVTPHLGVGVATGGQRRWLKNSLPAAFLQVVGTPLQPTSAILVTRIYRVHATGSLMAMLGGVA